MLRLLARLLERHGFTPNLGRRVTALETWRDDHEADVRDRSLRHEADLSEINRAIGALYEEIKADRQARLGLITLQTEAILEGFKDVIQTMRRTPRGGDGR